MFVVPSLLQNVVSSDIQVWNQDLLSVLKSKEIFLTFF